MFVHAVSHIVSASLVVVAVGGGCAIREPAAAYAPKATEPMAESLAGPRNFAPSEAVYENISVTAYHTQFPLVPKPETPASQRPFVEPVLFVANTFILPVTALVTEPLTEQVAYRPPGVASGSTAAVPLDDVVDASEYGAYRPNFKPGMSSEMYGHAPATLPSQYGKPEWMRPLPPSDEAKAQREVIAAPSTQPVLLP